ncbi:replication protein [Achromobacter pulmonis]|nr:replication protein [Achromobacter pulmonis]
MSAVVLPMTPKSPQLENGFMRISNELEDAILAHPLTDRQHKVLRAVMRKTYGFGKKEDDLSASQLASILAKTPRQHVSTALNELAAMKVIHKRPGRYGSVVGVNKNYAEWLPSVPTAPAASPESGQGGSPESGHLSQNGTCPESGQVSRIGDAGSPESGQVASPESGHTKDNLPKDNQQKEVTADAVPSGDGQLALTAPEETDAPPPVCQPLLLADGSEHLPTAQEVAEWSAAFPLVNVPDATRQMAVWLKANPAKRKTRRGINKFIVNWLGGAQRDASVPGHRNAVAKPAGKGQRQHGNFDRQDYRSGVDDDGRF